MSYPYFLVSYNQSPTKEISTNVYAADEDQARAIGSIELLELYGVNVTVEQLSVVEIDSITSETITTT